MGFGWPQKNVSPIAVDFGADTVKLLQIGLEDPPQLIAAAAADIPPEARKDADIRQAFLTRTVRELVHEAGFKGKRVIASIPSSHTFVQHVRLPKSDEPLMTQIEGELRGRLPIDPSRMIIRHYPVCDVVQNGSAKQEVLCLAASRESVMRHVQAVDQAGLQVVGMHCEPMAVIQAFSHLYRRAGDEKRVAMYVDIGSALTKVMITHGTQIVFAKNIHVAGDNLTRQVARAREVDLVAARLWRIQQANEQAAQQAQRAPAGLQPAIDSATTPAADRRTDAGAHVGPGLTPMTDTAAAQPAPAVVTAVAEMDPEEELIESLIDEVQLCVGYHRSLFADRPIEKVVFLGGEARHVELCRRIARALRLPAQLADPLVRLVRKTSGKAPVGIDLRQTQPGWAVPLGLCSLPTNL